MAEKKTLTFADFKDLTDHIYMAVDKMDTLYNSLDLSETQKAELSRLGGLLQGVSHEIGHLYLDLEALPADIQAAIHEYYGHGH
jgi:hypothetical protein